MRFMIAVAFIFLSGCASDNVINIDGSGNWKYVTNINGVSGTKVAALASSSPMVGGVISMLRMPPEDREVDLVGTKIIVTNESRIVFAAQFPKYGQCKPMLNINGDEYSPDLKEVDGICRYVIDDSRATHIAERLLEPGVVMVNNVAFNPSGFSRVWSRL
ncbi:hypothetical protein SL040_004516 [Aeromonas salmonicida]|nr:hypothetical protein [Aeromonas salmonicida]ELY2004142.1 hypothetical protein [Aeromonas salmonicida]